MEANEQIKRFGEFLENVYVNQIRQKIRKGEKFLVIDFPELLKSSPELADELAKSGIDALEISGNDTTRPNLDTPEKQSYYAPYAEKLSVDIPVILTGGNKNIDLIENICQGGKVDYFGFARPFIREPNLPTRWLEGVGNTECDCISCNLCAKYLFEGNNLVTCQVI